MSDTEKLLKKAEKKGKFDYDTVLNKIGFGRYQVYLFILVGMFGMIDGAETTINSFLINIFQK
jgi:hypothetical protein